jgi:phosphoglucomutase
LWFVRALHTPPAQVAKVLVGRDGFMSTPAVSCVIRNEQRVNGGIILTASHNPGGPKGDFGIKFNCDNGGPASDTVTDAIFEATKRIQQYYICKELKVDLTTIGTHTFNIGKRCTHIVSILCCHRYSRPVFGTCYRSRRGLRKAYEEHLRL